MENYQAIYDAVRSKISNCDIGAAVESALSGCGFEQYAQEIIARYEEVAAESMRPCVLFRPELSIDRDQWCALYGANIQDGIAGFGKSPSDAMHDFDKKYHTNLKPNKQEE